MPTKNPLLGDVVGTTTHPLGVGSGGCNNLFHGGRYRDRTCDLYNVNVALVPTELTALIYLLVRVTLVSYNKYSTNWHPRLLRVWMHFSGPYGTRSVATNPSGSILSEKVLAGTHLDVALRRLAIFVT